MRALAAAAVLGAACAGGVGAGGAGGVVASGALVALHPDVLVDEAGGRVIVRRGGGLETLELQSGRPLARCERCEAAAKERRATVTAGGLTLRIDRQAVPLPSGDLEEVTSIVASDAAGRVRWRRELETRRLPAR